AATSRSLHRPCWVPLGRPGSDRPMSAPTRTGNRPQNAARFECAERGKRVTAARADGGDDEVRGRVRLLAQDLDDAGVEGTHAATPATATSCAGSSSANRPGDRREPVRE